MQRLTAKTEGVRAEPNAGVLIERMTEHDLLEVVAIEEASGLSPWGWDAYHAELAAGDDSILLVARTTGTNSEDRVVGFVVARRIADEIHVNNFAVRPEFRRRGIGQNLMSSVLKWGRATRASHAVLEVRAGNEAAQRLYQTCGFSVVGRRKRYYKSPVEDALLMVVSLA